MGHHCRCLQAWHTGRCCHRGVLQVWRCQSAEEVFQEGFASRPRLREAEDLVAVVVAASQVATTAAAKADLLAASGLPDTMIEVCQLTQAGEGRGTRMRVFHHSAAAEGCQCCRRRGLSGQPEPIPSVSAQHQMTSRASGTLSSQSHHWECLQRAATRGEETNASQISAVATLPITSI